MYLTTLRIKRAEPAKLDMVLNARQLQALPRDDRGRVDAVVVMVAGKTAAVLTLGREAQDPAVVWSHEDLRMPHSDLRTFAKSYVTVLDAAQGALGPEHNPVRPEASPPPVRQRRARGTSAPVR